MIELAMDHPATLKLIRRSAFRLGFRREMIRRATESIKKRNEEMGIKSVESTADKMLVAVSSRKLDDEQSKEVERVRQHLDSAFDEGAPAAPPPRTTGGGGGGGISEAAVQQIVSQKVGEAEKKLMSKLEAISAQLEKIAAGGGS